MPELKPLQRYSLNEYMMDLGSTVDDLDEDSAGQICLYVDVKAREDLLRDALRSQTSHFRHNRSCKCPDCKANALLAQFDAEDHQ